MFPKDGFSRGHKPDIKSATLYAKALGIGIEFQRLLTLDKSSEEIKTFLEHFQNNLDLLIQKTWVEKSDERRKRALQDKVSPFVTTIEQGDYLKAIEFFGSILEELSFLFFGTQAEKDDFTEYTFRIDEQMGLFWWYSSKLVLLKELSSLNLSRDDKALWAILLIGLCFLTNF